MSDGVMKYAAGAALGLAGASGFIAGIVKMCSDSTRRNQEHARYIMEHPKEYEAYRQVERFQQLQRENEQLTDSMRTMESELARYRKGYDDSMRQLKSYVEKDAERLENTRKRLDAYFGEESD